MPTYTFRCPNGHEFDRRVSRDTYQVTSDSACGCVATAVRNQVYGINFGGFARTPAAERDWSRSYREFQEATHETKTVLPTFSQAKAAARNLARKGAKDANDVDVKRL